MFIIFGLHNCVVFMIPLTGTKYFSVVNFCIEKVHNGSFVFGLDFCNFNFLMRLRWDSNPHANEAVSGFEPQTNNYGPAYQNHWTSERWVGRNAF